jgi:hypothetical protein
MKADLDAMPAALQAEFTSQEHESAGEAAGLAGAFTFSASDLNDIAQTEQAIRPPRPDFPPP